jgi:hypothetical protein
MKRIRVSHLDVDVIGQVSGAGEIVDRGRAVVCELFHQGPGPGKGVSRFPVDHFQTIGAGLLKRNGSV